MLRGYSKAAKPFDPDAVIKATVKVGAHVKAVTHVMIGGEYVALTADHWTSVANDNYLGVTGHYINSKWEIKSLILR
jgi:hypothetical protein